VRDKDTDWACARVGRLHITPRRNVMDEAPGRASRSRPTMSGGAAGRGTHNEHTGWVGAALHPRRRSVCATLLFSPSPHDRRCRVHVTPSTLLAPEHSAAARATDSVGSNLAVPVRGAAAPARSTPAALPEARTPYRVFRLHRTPHGHITSAHTRKQCTNEHTHANSTLMNTPRPRQRTSTNQKSENHDKLRS
jgi:hypothetical protein